MGRLRYAQCLRASGSISEARRVQRQALELDDNLWFSHFLVGLDHLIDAETDEALHHGERAYRLAPWNPSAAGLYAAVLKIAGDADRARELVTQLEGGGTSPSPLGLAIYHLLCSDIDAAADWTERAIADRHPAIFYFLAHAVALRHSHRWPHLATLLNLATQ